MGLNQFTGALGFNLYILLKKLKFRQSIQDKHEILMILLQIFIRFPLLIFSMNGILEILLTKKINKTFKFTKYMESIDFVQKVAILAEKNNHHPDINIAWCTINISITSHELGGVSTKCINLATGIDFLIQ